MEQIINNHKIVYDDTIHLYLVDGLPALSVTQVLKMKYPDTYAGISPEILERAAAYGTKVHNAIEMYETYGVESNNIQEFRDYKFLKNYYKFKTCDVEMLVFYEHKGNFICGRLDQLYELNGSYGIADIKTTSTLHRELVEMQLNLYKLAYEYTYQRKIDEIAVIHVKRGVRKFIKLENKEKEAIKLLEEVFKMNKIILIGNLTKDVEVNTTNTGKKVANFNLAVKSNYKDANGEYGTTFFKCNAWEKKAEVLERYTHKGSKILVEGAMKSREYTKQDGTNATVWEVFAENIELLTPKSDAPAPAEKHDTLAEMPSFINPDDLPF